MDTHTLLSFSNAIYVFDNASFVISCVYLPDQILSTVSNIITVELVCRQDGKLCRKLFTFFSSFQDSPKVELCNP